MQNTPPDGRTDRIDDDHREPSPSTGSKETAEAMHATAGQTHTAECTTPDCDREGAEVRIVTEDDVTESVRCTEHAKHFLEVSS